MLFFRKEINFFIKIEMSFGNEISKTGMKLRFIQENENF